MYAVVSMVSKHWVDPFLNGAQRVANGALDVANGAINVANGALDVAKMFMFPIKNNLRAQVSRTCKHQLVQLSC